MEMKKLMSLLMTAVLILGLTACGGGTGESRGDSAPAENAGTSSAEGSGEDRTIRVGMSFNALMNDVFIKTDEYTKKFGAESDPKVEFIVTSADNDVSKQLADVKDLISQKVDVVVICPEDVAATDVMIKDCADAGIPVLIQNRPYNPDGQYKPDSFVGVDAVDQGYASVKEVFEAMLADGETELNLILCSGALSDQNSVDRTAGVMQAIEEYADRGARLVTELTTDWNPEWLEANLPSALRANPDANCLYIASDFLLPATQSALETAGQWIKRGEEGHIYIAATDVYAEGLTAIEEGYVDADSLMDIVNMSKTIVEHCVALSKGEKVEETYIKGPVFNPKNYNDPELQALLWG